MKLKGIELKGTYEFRCDTTSFEVYDEKGNEIYRENSKGKIIDERVKELTIEEIEKLLGYKIKIKGEKNESNKKRNK